MNKENENSEKPVKVVEKKDYRENSAHGLRGFSNGIAMTFAPWHGGAKDTMEEKDNYKVKRPKIDTDIPDTDEVKNDSLDLENDKATANSDPKKQTKSIQKEDVEAEGKNEPITTQKSAIQGSGIKRPLAAGSKEAMDAGYKEYAAKHNKLWEDDNAEGTNSK